MKVTKEEKIIQSKDWRKRLDIILQEMKEQQKGEARGEDSRHLALSITHLEDSIMRHGMRMKELDAPNPYPESYNPQNTNVAPTADNLKL